MRGKQHTYAALRRTCARGPRHHRRRSDRGARSSLLHDPRSGDGEGLRVVVRAEHAPMLAVASRWRRSISRRDRRTVAPIGSSTTTAPRARHRVDLVQCYDEAIISYSESRDVLRTDQSRLRSPAISTATRMSYCSNGRLAGHWRLGPARTGGTSRRGSPDRSIATNSEPWRRSSSVTGASPSVENLAMRGPTRRDANDEAP